MIPESFHFLRPAWLLALAPAALILWAASRSAVQTSAWRRLVDAHLLRHLLVSDQGRGRRWPLWALGAGWVATALAMAGPTWEQIPQPTWTSLEPTVVALDVSPAMDVADVAPSRLARARYELHDLLGRMRGGQVGLVLYADDTFVAAPLTDDGRVIDEMIPSLTPGVMPGRASRADRAIAQASALLEQSGAPGGSILLLASGLGDQPEATFTAARDAAAHGRTVSVLGIGSEAGAPLRDARGRTVEGPAGEPVISRVDREALDGLARAGGGRFALATVDDTDLDRIAPPARTSAALDASRKASAQADVWRDAGVWLLVVPLCLAPLAFRRGWLVGLALAALLAPAGNASAATTWDDLWKTRDQQGQAALAEGKPDSAAELFEEPAWKAASHYQGGDFEAAAKGYQGLPGVESRYNLGNALARAGQLEPAIRAYDEALRERPDHADAEFNRDLVQRLLDQQREQQRQSQSETHQGQGQPQDQQAEGQQNQAGESGQQGQSGQQDGSAQQDRQSQPQQAASAAGDAASQHEQGGQDDAEPQADQTAGAKDDQHEARPSPAGDARQQEQQQASAAQGADSAPEAGDQQKDDSQKARRPGEAPKPDPEAGERESQATASSGREPSDEQQEQAAAREGDRQQPAGTAAASRERDGGQEQKPPTGHGSRGGEREEALAKQMDQALDATPHDGDPGESPTPATAAAHRPTTEQDQAREQMLRQIPDDPGGLLRARIRRHFAENRISKQEGAMPW